MFPIRDHNPSKSFPVITVLIILITSYVFFLQLTAFDPEAFIMNYALVPALVDFGNPATWWPFIWSMFMHGGWLHIISNLWFLWIFGDNVEAFLGHIGFLLFYLLTGIAASLVQFFFMSGSEIPTLGASGAIAGVLGAYLVLYPRHKIDTLVISFGGFLQKLQIPASFMLGYWFIIQLFSGVGSLGAAGQGGVAWWAHIGGFASGYLFTQAVKGNNRTETEPDAG
ncbi:MAG: rhomboid family protein [Candidatus Gottesmanbacteria bacterium GW2011_GWA2_43_14]|uniref:Rhomboid family protein n=1 Tax=Candidatus Gottesmanbacteria bacterium GW2011_GWA2_43_14 TaxID=1618443 RepID=A0A0G1DEE5_9BACT|nr:MAG: rhomboid family protein [Candidatus Gottesmanbacteria bacterium GW2011_GWA2_43_14]